MFMMYPEMFWEGFFFVVVVCFKWMERKKKKLWILHLPLGRWPDEGDPKQPLGRVLVQAQQQLLRSIFGRHFVNSEWTHLCTVYLLGSHFKQVVDRFVPPDFTTVVLGAVLSALTPLFCDLFLSEQMVNFTESCYSVLIRKDLKWKHLAAVSPPHLRSGNKG